MYKHILLYFIILIAYIPNNVMFDFTYPDAQIKNDSVLVENSRLLIFIDIIYWTMDILYGHEYTLYIYNI
jgi:hypothetical protein